METLPDQLKNKISLVGDCWVWKAHRTKKGYGTVRYKGKMRKAHRVVYELLVGTIPDGLEIDHLCNNTSCVNPAHLEPVTPEENMRRFILSRQKTHCKYGHELTEENLYTYWVPRKGKWVSICKLCALRRAKSYYTRPEFKLRRNKMLREKRELNRCSIFKE